MGNRPEFGSSRGNVSILDANRAPHNRHHSSWQRRVIAAVLVAAALWAVAAALTLAAAWLDLSAGRRAARTARHQDVAAVAEGRPLGELMRARTRFRRARTRLGGALLAPVRVLPVAGRQIRSTRTLAAAAADASTVAVDAVRQGRHILSLPHQRGIDRVEQLRLLGQLAGRSDRRLAAIRLGSGRGLVSPVAHAYNELADDLNRLQGGLRRGRAAMEATTDLLAGPRRYLVFAANNAEMRAGSGMFLSVGELVTEGGTVRLAGMGTVNDVHVPPGAVAVRGDLAGRWGWLQPQDDWRNLMLSPRFDVSAALAAQMWAAAGRGPVDGVIALDPVALQLILEATGPATVGTRTIAADQILAELLHDQYVLFPTDEQVPERREELSAIATAAVTALEGGGWSPGRLADKLTAAARGRHVLLWSAKPEEQRAWETAGAAGSVGADSLLVALLNRGGNKLDQYVQVGAHLELHPNGGHTDGLLWITLDNRAPLPQPAYIVGPHPDTGLAAGEYLGILAVTLPGAAREGRFDGIGQLAVAGPDGPSRVIGVEVRVPTGTRKTLVARFRLPGRHGEMVVEPSARVPLETWRGPEDAWDDRSTRTVRW
jgi:uncharacterized protein DUF4012